MRKERGGDSIIGSASIGLANVGVRYSPIVSLLDGSLFGFEAVHGRLTAREDGKAGIVGKDGKDSKEKCGNEENGNEENGKEKCGNEENGKRGTKGEKDGTGAMPSAAPAANEGAGIRADWDRRWREQAIRGLPIRGGLAKLFLPVPVFVPGKAEPNAGELIREIGQAGLRPEHAVLTFRLPATDRQEGRVLRAALREYRSQGFRIALSGIRPDWAALREMIELQPDYAEIDVGWMSAEEGTVDGDRDASAAADSPGRNAVRAIDESLLGALAALTRKEQIVLLASGIVRESQLGPLVSCGVGYGRGSWIGEDGPGRTPTPIRPEARERIRTEVRRRYRKESGSLARLTVPVDTFKPETPVSEISRHFDNRRDSHGFVIAEEGRPVGLLMKEKLHQMLSGQYGLPLYWNRPVSKIMDTQPLAVDEATPVELVSQMAMNRETDKLYDAVVVTKDGFVRGIASIRSMLEWVTQERMNDAKWANPLTGLPGNEAIHREFLRRIEEGLPFAVLYADMDHFKWFNDRFGFKRGDEVIRFAGETLQDAIRTLGPEDGFVGHIGGDDFVALLPCEPSIGLADRVLKSFEKGIRGYVGRDAGPVVDRDGRPAEADGVSLSLSLLLCEQPAGWTPEQLAERAALLKKRAKGQRGHALVWESIAWSPSEGKKSTSMVGLESTT